jgi:hypothetical protein
LSTFREAIEQQKMELQQQLDAIDAQLEKDVQVMTTDAQNRKRGIKATLKRLEQMAGIYKEFEGLFKDYTVTKIAGNQTK